MFGKLDTYLLVSIPLFTLMAHFMIRGKVVDDLFGAAHTLLRHLPGGMGIATVAACTVFAAISGSSVATALTIGSAAIPLMIRYGYSPRFAYGVVGGGGTLGILIPPSGPMVLFGVVSDTSIGALFMAGVVPGLMLAADLRRLLHDGGEARAPVRSRTEPRATLAEVLAALRKSFWSLTLPVLVLGGMYFGVFTATEAAAAGALGALAIAMFVYRNFGLERPLALGDRRGAQLGDAVPDPRRRGAARHTRSPSCASRTRWSISSRSTACRSSASWRR